MSVPTQASAAFYSTIFHGLNIMFFWYAVVGAGVALMAIAAGPQRWALSLRKRAQDGLQGIQPDRSFGAFGRWVGAYAGLLRALGYAVAALALIIPFATTFSTLLIVSVGEIAWISLIAFFGSDRLKNASQKAARRYRAVMGCDRVCAWSPRGSPRPAARH
jgi:hypothetical protein